MIIVVAVALPVVAVQLKPAQENNIRVEKMRNILMAANIETTVQNAEDLYKKFITSTIVVNNKGETVQGDAFSVDFSLEVKKSPEQRQLPVYIFSGDGKEFYIVPVRGKGLWGPIWGYIAFKNDLNTIEGAVFDHKGETPGLGAEIDTRKFQSQFSGKQIFDGSGEFKSVAAKKGGAPDGDLHGVDAISGGTITSDGLSKMLRDCLIDYVAFFKSKTNKS